jgi:hypothetical protein
VGVMGSDENVSRELEQIDPVGFGQDFPILLSILIVQVL